MCREMLQCEIFKAAVRVSVQQRAETQTHRNESEKTDVMFMNLLVSSSMFMSCRQAGGYHGYCSRAPSQVKMAPARETESRVSV